MYLLVFLLLQVSDIGMDNYYIKFERSGGFAGITQTLELKTDTLSVEDRDHLSKLIDTSGFFEYKAETGSGMPDQFNYVILIKSRDKEKTVELGDARISEKMRPLVDYLSKLSRKR